MDLYKKTSRRRENNIDSNIIEHSLDKKAETTIRKYQDDKDFDEAFKNLLHPIESITKKSNCEALQYNLLKELDSYLNHLKGASNNGSSIFVEAALMIQNVILIYQKRVDQYIEVMMNLVAKFRAYRRNLNDNTSDDVETEEVNKRKKKEKKVKLYPSFEPIKSQLGSLKIYDCKLINLSKKPGPQKLVLNSNIKVDNKLSKLLPYITIGNGENIGKKYDFLVNCFLNLDLAVNEEFDCSTNEKSDTPLNCLNQNNSFPRPMDTDDDRVDADNELPATPDPVVFDQTVNDVVVQHTAALPSANVIDTDKIPHSTGDGDWNAATAAGDYSDKPIIINKHTKREDNGVLLPSYTMTELYCQMIKLKSDIGTDPEFRRVVYCVREAQKSNIAKKRMERIKANAKNLYCDDEISNILENDDGLGFKGFENGNVDFIFDDNHEDATELVTDIADGYQAYQKNALDMEQHEQNQIEIMNEQLEMRKRVQNWHDNLRPVLEAEEKRTEFDVHEYGTKVLDCFSEIGEQKSFKALVGGLEHEEIARYFLSTLMMTNTCNVKITNETLDGDIKIELLKKERHHEQLQVNIGNQVNQDSK